MACVSCTTSFSLPTIVLPSTCPISRPLLIVFFSCSLYQVSVTLLFNCLISFSHAQEMFCDVTLACDGALFPVHRLVLAMCSEFFNQILTNVPSQPSMVVLVPTVSAADLEALITYIYVGEIRISQSKLPSLMKAAQTLKIKGLCNTNGAVPWDQYVNRAENEEGSEETHIIPDVEGRESDSHDSIMFEPPYCSPEPVEEPQQFPQVQEDAPALSQVCKFCSSVLSFQLFLLECSNPSRI